MKAFESVTKQQKKNSETISERVHNLELIENTKTKQKMKCPECDFSTGSAQVLKNHKTRKYKIRKTKKRPM